MKPQDIIFFIILLTLLFVARKPRVFVTMGLVCLLVSIPLFSFWVFFTAQKIVYYAAGFFLVSIILHLITNKSNK